MSLNFEHVTLGQRVLFGSGQGRGESGRGGCPAGCAAGDGDRLASSRRRSPGAVAAGIDVALWYDDVVMHVPVEVAEKARAAAAGAGIDLLRLRRRRLHHRAWPRPSR